MTSSNDPEDPTLPPKPRGPVGSKSPGDSPKVDDPTLVPRQAGEDATFVTPKGAADESDEVEFDSLEDLDATVVGGGGNEATMISGSDADEDATFVQDTDGDMPTSPPLNAPKPAASKKAAREAAARRAKDAREESDKKSAQVFADRFEVIRTLGEGGMGKVYQVHDRQIEGREIALKVLRARYSRNKQFRDLFFQEIRAAQKFVSEHVCQVRDTGQLDNGTLYLTMDFVAGEDLSALMKREKGITPRHALEIARQTLIALNSGHEQGFIHRDVKPPNIMLRARIPKSEDNPFGVGVKVLDFGIASLAAEADEGGIAGTPTYMAPEQLEGERLDPRADLFAVGIILYEMISGKRPFEGDTIQEIQTSVLHTNIAPMIRELEDVPPQVRKLLTKALQVDRAKRFQSATEFIEAIEGSKAFKEPKSTPGWLMVASVLMAFTIAGETFFLMEKRQEVRELKSQALLPGDRTAIEFRDTLSAEHGTSAEDILVKLSAYDVLNDRLAKIDEKDIVLVTRNLQNNTDLVTRLQEDRLALKSLMGEVREHSGLGDSVSWDAVMDKARRGMFLEGLVGASYSVPQQVADALTSAADARALQKEVQDLEAAVATLESWKAGESVNAKKRDYFMRLLSDLHSEGNWAERGVRAAVGMKPGNSDVFGEFQGRGGILAFNMIDAAESLKEIKNAGFESPDGVKRCSEALEAAYADLDSLKREEFGNALYDASSPKNIWLDDLNERYRAAEGDSFDLATVRAEAILASMKTELDSVSTKHMEFVEMQAGSIGEDWNDLVQGFDPSDPSSLKGLLTFARTHSLDVSLPLKAFASTLSGLGTGSLDRDALEAKRDAILAWVSHLETGTATEASAELALVHRLHAAIQWYLDTLSTVSPEHLSTKVTAPITTPTYDWHMLLALQARFVSPELQGLFRKGTTVMSRVDRGSDKLLGWEQYDCRANGEVDGSESWTVTYRPLDTDGSLGLPREPTTEFRLNGWILQLKRHNSGEFQSILDLRDNTLMTSTVAIPVTNQPPLAAGQEGAYADFLKGVQNIHIPCIYIDADPYEYWISPDYGIVREATSNRVRSLVFQY